MLLFHRPFTEDNDVAPFQLSTAGMPIADARKLILDNSRYKGNGDFVDCSDLEEDPVFNHALIELHAAVGSAIYELLSAEFSDASNGKSADRGVSPLMYLESRMLGTNLLQVAQELLLDHYDKLDVVLEAIHQRADVIRGNIRTEDIE